MSVRPNHVVSVLADEITLGSGDEVSGIAPGLNTGSLFNIYRGTETDPDTSKTNVLKINQWVESDGVGMVGDGSQQLAGIQIFIKDTPANATQPVGIRATVANYSDQDTAPGYFAGRQYGSGPGRGIGVFSIGEALASGTRADGAQIAVNNSSGQAHAVLPTGTSYSTGIWITPLGTNRSAVGIQLGNGFGTQFDVGFHVNGQTAASPTATVQTASVASPTVITTTAAHGLEDGDQVVITGSNSTPSINGTYTATVTGETTFTIPVNVTGAGSSGSVTGRIGAALSAAFRDDSNAKNGLHILGSHSTAAVNLSDATGGPSLWLPNAGDDSTGKGRVIATNMAGTGVQTILNYRSDGYLRLHAETAVRSQVIHHFGGGIYIGAMDIATDTSTGTKVGTGSTQKLGFYGATPIARPSGVAVSAAGIHAALVSLGLIAA